MIKSSPCKITPVILAGGAGHRLWPLSSSKLPKQLLHLYSEQTALQETLLRFQNSNLYAAPIIICALQHMEEVRLQVQNINIQKVTIIAEPAPRGTAAAAIISALYLKSNNSDNLMLLAPCDHIIDDIDYLNKVINSGVPAAQNNKIVTFGITPPEHIADINIGDTSVGDTGACDTSVCDTNIGNTSVGDIKAGYGYIKKGKKYNKNSYQITEFIEKPNIPYAHKLLAEGGVYYNSGIFLAKPAAFLDEAQYYNQEMTTYCSAALQQASSSNGDIILDELLFSQIIADTIDYAIIEKTQQAVMIPFDGNWLDVGSYRDLWKAETKDENANRLIGDIKVNGVTNSYIYSNTKQKIIVIGAKNLVVSVTDDAILVSSKNNVDKIKTLL